ncbi:hypothetical protein DFH07DRAFT_958285 [Mycena maculata]|uniref:Uncharacterized protein n=1 Tax=Mycena maculata TaxID=230809 RepID=A0AAD7J875_9AGAR|nr:hypothetical protein DFH07DRAFT_958285 [Mycena maculata]
MLHGYNTTNARYKREAYCGSESAARILAENGLTVLTKSGHPVLNSRYLLYKAQEAYFYGLPENLVIAVVAKNPAEVMGMGLLYPCSIPSPLVNLPVVPVGMPSSGIPTLWLLAQLQSKFSLMVFRNSCPRMLWRNPKRSSAVPNFDTEAQEAVEYNGLPPLKPTTITARPIVFVNVQNVFAPAVSGVEEMFSAMDNNALGTVVAEDGQITCVGVCPMDFANATVVDLQAGSISPRLVSFGSPLGLEHITTEESTLNGLIYDLLSQNSVPEIVEGDSAIICAADRLLFCTRDALLAYHAGVTSAVIALSANGVFTYSGLGVSFSLSAGHKLEHGAILQDVTGVHVMVVQNLGPSVSTQIALLCKQLLCPVEGLSKEWLEKVTAVKHLYH